MPGPILHVGAQLMCPHLGQATPVNFSPRVMVMGQPITTLSSQYAVAGCTFPAMTLGSPPCVTAQFVTSATRVLSDGQPVLLLDSQATTIPNGVPLLPVVTQTRVIGQ
jgi:uncharacterized Zn-binding protein involved in type VI secretion